jgi:hypothetical protein
MDRALALHTVENLVGRMRVHRAFLARFVIDVNPDVVVVRREQGAFRAVAGERALICDVDEKSLHHSSFKRRHGASSSFVIVFVTR